VGGGQQGPILTNSAIAVSNGLFTVTLDFGNQFPGAPRWLDISVRTNGNGAFAPLSPRQPLTATPYATTAGTATSLGGTYSGAVTLNNPANSFSGNGANLTSLNASQLTSGTVGDARLSTNVALRAGGNAFTSNQTITAGNLGVGTISPTYPLTFAPLLGDKIALYPSGGNTSFGFGIQSFQMQIHVDTPAADIVFGSGQSTNLSETMRIKGSGNVGIGTANPGANTLQINTNFHSANGYALQVNRNDFGANIQVNRTNGQSGIGLVVDNSSSGNATTSLLLVRNNVASSPQNLLNLTADGNTTLSGSLTAGGTFTGNGSGLTSLSASSLGSGTVADARLSGNVALRAGGNMFSGTQSNAGNLYLTGGGALLIDNSVYFYAKNSLGAYDSYLVPRWSDNGMYMSFGDGGFILRDNYNSYYMTVETNRAISLYGTLNLNGPQNFPSTLGDKLALYGGVGNNNYGFGIQPNQLQIHTLSSGDDVVFGYGQSTNLTETMRIKGNGKVGIGTSTPGANLQVVNSSGVGVFVGNRGPFGGAAFETDYTTSTTHDGFAENGANVFNIGPGGSGYFAGDVGIGSGNQQLSVNHGFNNVTMNVKARSGDLYALNVEGTPANTVSIFWTVSSDARLKQDVQPYELGLNELLQLQTVRYRYRDDEKHGLSSQRDHTGVIAQEVQKVFPEAVIKDQDGYLALQPDAIF